MVLIEAMACGTPVVAWSMGSVPEIIEDGKNGFIVNSIEEAISAVGKISSLNRSIVRKVFEDKFTSKRMATDYLKVYDNLILQQESNKPVHKKSLSANLTTDLQNMQIEN